MRNIFLIAKRELQASFFTPLAYALLAGFLVLAGFFFFFLLQEFNGIVQRLVLMSEAPPSLNQWVITPYYHSLEIVLIFVVPLLTMRAIAEERRLGTFELLLTSPLKVSDVVLGKFLGLSALLLLMLILSFSYPLALLCISDPEALPTLVGLFGLCLFGLSYLALGIGISSFAANQTVAGMATLVVLLLFYAVDAPAVHLGEPLSAVLEYLAPSGHTEHLLRGVIDGADVVYFVSVSLIGLFVANRVLDAERWR